MTTLHEQVETVALQRAEAHARLEAIAEAVGWNVTRSGDGDGDGRVIVRHGLKEIKHFRGKNAMDRALRWVERRQSK